MSQKHHIKSIIKRYITTNHTIGDRAGGSGGMGYNSYTLDKFDFKQIENGNFEVSFKYTVITESEFIDDPDNPPIEVKHEASLSLDRELKLVDPN
jgi:hypothetical protein